MPGSWSDFLKLRSGPAPPPSSEAGAVRVYADANGVLRSVQSDGTDAAIGGGGGGSTPVRNVGQVELDFNGLIIGSNATEPVPFVFADGDPAMLDLSNPAVPLPVEAGIYAYTLRVSAVASSQGVASLVVDDDYYSLTVAQFQPAAVAVSVSVTWFCTAGSPFHASIHSDAGETYSGNLYVQKVG